MTSANSTSWEKELRKNILFRKKIRFLNKSKK